MDGQPTRAGWRAHVPGEWSRWRAFLRRPEAPPRADLSPVPALRAMAPLFALDLLIMALLLGALGAAMALGFEMPEHMLGEMKLDPSLIAFIVLLAPLGEEIVFRGWLSGRPGHVIGPILAIVAIVLLVTGGAAGTAGSAAAAPLALGAIGASALAALAVFLLRRRDAPAWYRRHFGWFFYASALGFAAIHLTNFAAAGLAALPLVLPQLMLALFLGYMRVRHGLWSSVLMHMLHNGVFIGVVVLSGQ